ncbi:MAG: protein translocase subunit SecD [Gemmatimonadales bacterium]|nr:protein translocase subunit SecD [Gemmatimonadales bacterium]
MSIRTRLLVILALVALSVYHLIPREVTLRERDLETGVMRDNVVTRVPLKLGLDLQGGMHLAMELDQSRQVSADPARDLDLALTVLRKRIDEFGVAEPVVQKVGDERIVVELAGIDDPARAKSIVQRTAFLEFRITDEANALEKAIPAMDRVLRRLGVRGSDSTSRPSAVEQLLGGDSASRPARGDSVRGDSAEGAGARTDSAGRDSAARDSAPAGSAILGSLIQPGGAAGGGAPGEYMVPETAFPRVDSLLNISEVARQLPRGVVLRWAATPLSVGTESYRFLYALEDRPIITGSNLEDAQAQIDQLTNGPIVTFQLDRAGGRKFGDETGRHVNDYMAIVLDGRVQGRPPVIQSRIGRNGQITLAGRTLQEAQDLALTLKAGALPIPLKIVEERQIGPTLGEDAINSGILSGVIGALFVVVVMTLYYRTAGALAVCALALYVLFTLGGLAMLDATLTLPGLAGLVLSIGIAVDANVLIFERIREELAAGKTVRLAVDEGFSHAMSAIIDSNVTTALTGLFLFQFGTGPVRGFAVTLILGIAASMVTAIFVTRTLFLLWLDRKPSMATLSI